MTHKSVTLHIVVLSMIHVVLNQMNPMAHSAIAVVLTASNLLFAYAHKAPLGVLFWYNKY